MSSPIEDYGIIGNTYAAALVSREGSIDWLCLPRFDSEAVFAALLGEPNHGRWLISPVDPLVRVSRCYRAETGILETHFETPEGNTKIVDFMALSEEGEDQVDLIRLVYGEKGRVRMHTEIVLRFDYGRSIPWVRQHLGGPVAVAGPNAIQFITPVALRGTPDMTTIGEFTVEAGETVPFTMSWYPSHHKAFRYRDPYETLLGTETRWHDWSSTAWSAVTQAPPKPTGCRPVKAFFSPAASGSPTAWRWLAAARMRSHYSSGYSRLGTISGCSPRNTTRLPSGSSEISRRLSHTPRSSIPRRTFPNSKPRPPCAAVAGDERGEPARVQFEAGRSIAWVVREGCRVSCDKRLLLLCAKLPPLITG